jgi:hypothetical protein
MAKKKRSASSTLLSEKRAIERMWNAIGPSFDLFQDSTNVETAFAPLRASLKAASDYSSIPTWLEQQTTAITASTRDAMLQSAGEQTLTLLSPFRTYAETVLAQQEFAAFTSQRLTALRGSLLEAIPGFLDDISASAAEGSEQQEPPAVQNTETAQVATPDVLSSEQLARARLILWIALLFVAAFITSGSVTDQIAGGVDPFKGGGLEDLGGLTAIIFFIEKLLALQDKD